MNKSLILKLLLPLFTLSIISAIIALVAYIYNQALISSFMVNIATDFIGIIITVFIIDQLLKQNEKNRWLPAQQIVYAKSLDVCYRAIYSCIPNILQRFHPKHLAFGSLITVPSFEINKETYIFAIKNIDVENEGKKYREIFTKFKDELDAIIEQSIFLFEPELTHSLYLLERAVEGSILVYPNEWNVVSIMEYTNIARSVLLTTLNVMSEIEKKATQILTNDEMNKRSTDIHKEAIKLISSVYKRKDESLKSNEKNL